jgi:hypothetical protein
VVAINAIVTGAAAVAASTPMVRGFTNAIPGGPIGKIAVGAAAVWGGSKLDGIAGAALTGFGVGIAMDGLLSVVLVKA